MRDLSYIEVKICIAMREDGFVRCLPCGTGNIQREHLFNEMLQEVREDTRFRWSLKTIKTKVPMPWQFEEID
jgi:hypothetical protein